MNPAEYVQPGRNESGFAPDGHAWVGRTGRAIHHGPPLTAKQVADLADGTEIVITWFGGNGPHPYRVLVDTTGQRRVEGLYCDPIPNFHGDRITLGWDDQTRAWATSRPSEPAHIRTRWAELRAGDAA